jgi:hypothetical protein
MWLELPIFILLACLSLAFACMAWVMAHRLAPEHEKTRCHRWLLSWIIKGLAVPIVLWAILNAGVSWGLQPLMPQVQAAQAQGQWLPAYLRVLGHGAFIICSYWTALTLGWVIFKAGSRVEGELVSDFRALCLTSLLGMLLPAAGIVLVGGWAGLGLAVTAMLVPIGGYAPTLLRPKKMPPMYARAIAKMKFGKYSDAEWEIIRELEKSDDDFEGWMMLADLYAMRFNDLAEAEQTVLEICDQPRTTPSQMSVALHRLADWHLSMAANPDAARAVLEIICTRLRGTHLDKMARLRINQLPQTSAELLEQRAASPIPLPALGDRLDAGSESATVPMSPDEATSLVNGQIEILRENPNNTLARERLARLFAEQLDRADLAIEQVQLLLEMPEQPEARRVEWLSLLAAWHIRHRRDDATGRRLLEQLIREFPQSPQAFAASQRISLMDMEQKSRSARAQPPPVPKLAPER